MSSPQRVTGEAFALERLRSNPDLDYATLRTEASQAGISLQPIHYGRARKQLGLPALRDSRPAPVERGEAAAALATTTPADSPDAEPAARASAPRKGSVAFDFLVQELRREPALVYGELRDRAASRGHTIAPIMYGRAKAVLGLVPVKPRGSKRAAEGTAEKISAEKGTAAKTAGPRSLKQVDSFATERASGTRTAQLDSVRGLDQLVSVVKDLDAERRRLRATLERIAALIQETLHREG